MPESEVQLKYIWVTLALNTKRKKNKNERERERERGVDFVGLSSEYISYYIFANKEK